MSMKQFVYHVSKINTVYVFYPHMLHINQILPYLFKEHGSGLINSFETAWHINETLLYTIGLKYWYNRTRKTERGWEIYEWTPAWV